MSYRLYIATRKSSLKENLLEAVDKHHKKEPTAFNIRDFISENGFHIVIEIGNDSRADKIRRNCRNFFPDDILYQFYEYLPQTDKEDKYIGELTKKDLIDYVKLIHLHHIKSFKDMKNTSSPIDIACYAKNRETLWTASLELINENHFSLPYVVTSSDEYLIFQLTELITKTDWSETELVIFGY